MFLYLIFCRRVNACGTATAISKSQKYITYEKIAIFMAISLKIVWYKGELILFTEIDRARCRPLLLFLVHVFDYLWTIRQHVFKC